MSPRILLWVALWTLPALVCLLHAVRSRRLVTAAALLAMLLAGGFGITLKAVDRVERWSRNEAIRSDDVSLWLPGARVGWGRSFGADGALLARSTSWEILLPPSLLIGMSAYLLLVMLASPRRVRHSGG